MNQRAITQSLTILTRREINDISDSDINDPQEALILLLKFLLIKYLHGQDTIFGGTPIILDQLCFIPSDIRCSHIETLIPVWVERPLDDRCRFGLLAAESRHSERVRESCKSYQLMTTTLREYVAYGRHHACITHQPQLLQ